MTVPSAASVVVVGGGIVGASVLYHLALRGHRDALLLEQGRLAGGTTWHSAGQVGRLRPSPSFARMLQRSAELYAALEAETGVATGWNPVGSLNLARRPERLEAFRRAVALGRHLGVEAELIEPAEALARWPLLRVDDVLGGVLVPGDGIVDPEATTRALAAGARARGGRVCEDVRVLGLRVDGRRVCGVDTSAGPIVADDVVICAGMWSWQLGRGAGVGVPLHPVEHHYVVTGDLGSDLGSLPMLRDQDGEIYVRGDGRALRIGAFQHRGRPWSVPEVPKDFSFRLLQADWDGFAGPWREAVHRIPALAEAPVERFVNGPESFTPDGYPLVGPLPELDRLWCCAGFNSLGIASAGGVGEALAAWLCDRHPPLDLWSMDPRRFSPAQAARVPLRQRVAETIGLWSAVPWPRLEPETARGLRRSSLHHVLAARGAVFGVRAGMERPSWFAGGDGPRRESYSFERPGSFAAERAEHLAVRERVGVFDLSSLAHLRVHGRGACRALQHACAGDVDVPAGGLVYTPMLSDRGTFESDVTVARLAEDDFLVVTGAAQRHKDHHHLAAGAPDGVAVEDLSAAIAVLAVMGPRARDVLGALTTDDLSSAAFPFGTWRQVEVAGVPCRALRITYVGELGWELHVDSEQAPALYERLVERGAGHGLVDAGYHALESLRVEKAYRAWGHELSTAETPLEAGLSFAVAWDKATPFRGRDALLRAREARPDRRLLAFVADDPAPVLWGGEPILRDGSPVGYTTSAAYGHAVGAAVALGYVAGEGAASSDWLLDAAYTVDLAGRLVQVRPSLTAPYDPTRARVLA